MSERLEEEDVVKEILGRPNHEGDFASNGLLQAFTWMTGKIEIEARDNRLKCLP
jgi:hypothetical protein